MNLVLAFDQLLKQYGDVNPMLRLAIVGDGPMRGDIEKKIVELKIQDRVWLSGSRDDIPHLLRSMDIFVLPSKGEGISNTILEAMATGLPVVATNVGGNPELVSDGDCGQLVLSADPMAMARALTRYIKTPLLIEEQGRAARRRVENLFSMRKMVEKYLSVYENSLRSNDRLYNKLRGVQD